MLILNTNICLTAISSNGKIEVGGETMEVRILKYFLAVALEQNISAAAQSLYLSQPTLSRQLKELEDELGKQLFIRGNRKITLTEDGMFLRKRAEEIVELIDKTEKEISLSEDNVSGEIYIGAGETDGIRIIAKAAKELQEEYPQINYHIASGDAVDILERLDRGLIDFALLLDPVDISKYSYLKFPVKDVWGVLIAVIVPLPKRTVLTLQICMICRLSCPVRHLTAANSLCG